MSFPPSVPEDFSRTQASRGGAGLTWLNRLPALTGELARGWSLRVEVPFANLSYDWVPPRSAKTTPRPS